MSKKTVSQMEAQLLDRINSAKLKITKLKQKHKTEIGNLAYKHGLYELSLEALDFAFAKLAKEIKGNDVNQGANHAL